ncbi:MAG: ImmA/IrrE family metallo-endopeptidase [Burkholderiales bacterium]|nr:MAG: ImmA/IrrE family metallo-endopeptidase [Burkholderiales bacterium]
MNPLALAEQAGVAVMAKPMERLLGAFLREQRPGILLNSERPIGMVHMTCAHELGHYHLGHMSTSDEHLGYGNQSEEVEQEANHFAYSLMTPRWLVARAMRAKGWSQSSLLDAAVVYQLSLRLGVSFTGMVWGLWRLKFLPPHAAQALAKTPPRDLKNRTLPTGIEMPALSDVWLLDERDKDWVIEPRSTDRFIVRLPSHATAGYLWSAQDLTGEGFTLKPVTIDARQKPQRNGPPRVGGEAEDLYVLDYHFEDPEQRGRTTAQLQESQPWNKATEAHSQVAMAMEFEKLELGLSAGTRAREVEEEARRGA